MERILFNLTVLLLLCYGAGLPRSTRREKCEETFQALLEATPEVNAESEPEEMEETVEAKEYTVFNETMMNFYKATEFCFRNDLRLATFADEDEYNQLVAAISETLAEDEGGNFYFAASDLGQYNNYIFISSGQPMTYRNFFPGEPNHASSTERCLVISHNVGQNRYGMNDVSCGSARFYVCEKPT